MNKENKKSVTKPGHGKARERILESALTMFAYDGFDSVSTSDIAERAGCSQSAVMYHFSTKRLLWEAAMRKLFKRIDAHSYFDNEVYKDLGTDEKLRILLRRFVLISARFPELGRVIVREGVDRSDRLDWIFKELASQNYAVTEAIFEAGMKDGTLKSYPPAMLTLMMHGAGATLFNQASLSEHLVGKSPFDKEVVELQAEMLTDILLGGLLQNPSNKAGSK